MGLFTSIGKMFNDISGVTASAQQNWKYQKEMAQNAHQWEVQDLQKAGLNPALSAGGSGASTGGAGGGAVAGIGGFTDFANSAMSAAETISDIKLKKAQIQSLEAGTEKTKEETGNITPTAQKGIEKMDSEIVLNKKKEELINSEKSLNEAKKSLTQTQTTATKGAGSGYTTGKIVEAAEKAPKKIKKMVNNSAKKNMTEKEKWEKKYGKEAPSPYLY